ncbi:CLUMA_CG003849, isoform A [Clunio marinus]|uniref:CLUMA_CG003849, isoform A n=1 Tax=Clunio marinus TaxID=568069 RepID=A0A1J1HRW8_9DIPT|nr:CLUMA_CG003849, isoform A [Clunio marinus]
MVLIKVADISNEARPMDVAEPWLDRLLQEFFAQSAAEKMEGLPVTPFMDPDKVSKPGSQVRFIGLVLLPLFEALGELLPELIDFIIIPVRVALDFYKRLNDAAQKNRKSLAETEGSSDGDEIIPRSQSGISVRSRRSIPSQKSNSKNSVDEETMLIAAELHDLPEGSESGDSETATEVDVAEKTSKFKVDTESRNKLNNMQMTYRKGHHRDKRPSMVSEMGSRVRGSYGNLQHNYNSRTSTFGSNRAISLDHYNHRRMSDGIQTVTSDSTVYYHQRLNEQDVLLRASIGKKSSSLQGTSDVKLLVSEDSMTKNVHHPSDVTHDECDEPNRVQSNNNNSSNNNNNSASLASKNLKSKMSSSVSCSPNSPKSIITRLRQLTGRLSFSFDKESRRMSSGGTQTIIKTSPASVNSSSKNNNMMMPNICCNVKNSIDGHATKSDDVSARHRAYSLDVPTTKYFNNSSGASSNDGSRKSLSSNKNDEADDSTENNSAFASKKMSSEVEAPDI